MWFLGGCYGAVWCQRTVWIVGISGASQIHITVSGSMQRAPEEARSASQRIRKELTEHRLHRSWPSQQRPGWKHQPVVSQWETSRRHFGVWNRPLACATLPQLSNIANPSKHINYPASGCNAQGDHKCKQTEQGKGVTRSKEKRRQEGRRMGLSRLSRLSTTPSG